MKKRNRLLFLLVMCGMLSVTGCRHRETETETETQSETVSETETQKASETEPQTEKPTTTVKRTSVLPSTVPGNGNTGQTNATDQTNATGQTNKTTASTNKTTTDPATTATQQCPYCYQQISTAPDGNGSTIYEAHVAQEKAWADLNGYDPNTTPTTETNQATSETQQTTGADDSAQCGYCYQWFSVSDGSYAEHLAAENAALGMPEGTEYITCPICGYAFPKGSMYDNHVHVTE